MLLHLTCSLGGVFGGVASEQLNASTADSCCSTQAAAAGAAAMAPALTLLRVSRMVVDRLWRWAVWVWALGV